jgi:Mg2+ and Co2+ transporter CorA
LSSGTVCLSLYSLVAGVFGMNIPYTWNDGHGYIFKWVGFCSQHDKYNDALLCVT